MSLSVCRLCVCVCVNSIDSLECVCSQCPLLTSKLTRRILNFIDDLCLPRVAFNFSSLREIFTHFAAAAAAASALSHMAYD